MDDPAKTNSGEQSAGGLSPRKTRRGMVWRVAALAGSACAVIACAVAVNGGFRAGSATSTRAESHVAGTSASTNPKPDGAEAPADVLAIILPSLRNQMGITFPADAVTQAQARAQNAKEEILKSAGPGASLVESDMKSLFVVGGKQNGNDVSVMVQTNRAGVESPDVGQLFPGSHPSAKSTAGSCTASSHDKSDPRGNGVIRTVMVQCRTGMLSVVAGSPDSATAIAPEQVSRIAAEALS